MPLHIVYLVYGVLLLIILLEAVLICYSRRSIFSWKESLTSLGIAIGHLTANAFLGIVPTSAFSAAWQHRLMSITLDRGWKVLLLFLGIEFCYYWHHRLAHKIRWLWATHAVHHSTRHLNLSAAYRLGWTGWLSGNFLFFMPLCWLGFHPIAVTMGLGLNLSYQFWIHTELISKLGWLEYVLNTPSHHRVHHASNVEYVDCNYGGVLILFDRLFGTFTPERPNLPRVYGLTYPLRTYNPMAIVFYEWCRLFQDLIAAKTWRKRCRMLCIRAS
jgi:sterol desaturase/sphingolipid hydroxylase (fatty acid hydroxylase superfamily)